MRLLFRSNLSIFERKLEVPLGNSVWPAAEMSRDFVIAGLPCYFRATTISEEPNGIDNLEIVACSSRDRNSQILFTHEEGTSGD